MHMPRPNNSSPASHHANVLDVENLLLKSGCEFVSIGRGGGVMKIQTRLFRGGQMLLCDPREAFAMRIRSSENRALAVVPLENGTPLVHEGLAIPDGGTGFSLHGKTQIVHARGGTRFAVLWISQRKARPASLILPPPPDGHFGRLLAAVAEDDAEGLARIAESMSKSAEETLAAIENGEAKKNPRRLAVRMALVETIWDFIRVRLEDDLSLERLQGITGKSSRTLEYAFREIVGRTPVGFIKAMRLQKARRLLIQGRHVTVNKVAAACGLKHFGRFSIDYRLHFGERPSHTRKFSLAGK